MTQYLHRMTYTDHTQETCISTMDHDAKAWLFAMQIIRDTPTVQRINTRTDDGRPVCTFQHPTRKEVKE